ncbi:MULTISPECIES: transporter substrate-binding domain-containing protein [unclassified Pseudomonas]|uniref:substrate-binding periplasmic protein n=1 Tax=unclassified Pseudomonas TaxID=196821 RepID=UPI00244CD6F5|nr:MULTISPECIES: transporter substrate-binding domain-containing protein [unclassified Pseudomonas]MDG9925222.1 transporter substrate-binding domain-containing protein [Pseudomonas sp. GD04045]MDH0036123.1 transporter substrate-binding domain-containing protein [Pseudomonas sp. GD04019]
MRLLPLLFALLLPLAATADEVRLTNGEWSPYLGQNLPHHGVASRIVEEAFALEGVRVKWEFYPWARALRSAERGNSDGSAVWLRSPEREQAFFISEPVVESGYYLFHRKDRPLDWRRVSDLQGLSIGGAIDYDYGQEFQLAERDGTLKVKRLSNEEQGLRMLLAGRLDVFPMDKVVAFDMLHSQFSREERSQLSFHPLPLRSDSLHLLLSKKVPGNEQRMAQFNRGLKALQDSGKVSQYLLEIQQPLSLAY